MIVYQNVDDEGFKGLALAFPHIDNILWSIKTSSPKYAEKMLNKEVDKMIENLQKIKKQLEKGLYVI